MKRTKKTETVTVHAAKTHLSALLKRVESGEVVIIARGRKAIARLVPISVPEAKRCFGAMRGQAKVDAAFFEPLPEEELTRWE